MSSASIRSVLDPDQEENPNKGLTLAKRLLDAAQFLRNLSTRLRFGELSRAPLQLIRFELLPDVVECDWLARLPDPWDVDLPFEVRERHKSLQTLKDAIDVRALLFTVMPQLETAYLRVYRPTPTSKRELILTGYVQRNDNPARAFHSLAMRAKVLGFRFHLEGDSLRSSSPETQTRRR
jgi:hypothetical protein